MVYEYALRITHVDTAEARTALHDFVRERGDVAYVIGADEYGKSERLHFHAVIRTETAKHKKDENVFQKNGRMDKYLQGRVKGFNPASFVAVKWGWKAAVSYAVKHGCVSFGGFDFKPEDYTYEPKTDEPKATAAKKSLSDVLLRVWEENEKPTKLCDIHRMLWTSPDTTPGAFDPTLIMRKSLWLFQRVNPEASANLEAHSYARTCERMFGEVPDESDYAKEHQFAPIFRK